MEQRTHQHGSVRAQPSYGRWTPLWKCGVGTHHSNRQPFLGRLHRHGFGTGFFAEHIAIAAMVTAGESRSPRSSPFGETVTACSTCYRPADAAASSSDKSTQPTSTPR